VARLLRLGPPVAVLSEQGKGKKEEGRKEEGKSPRRA
jgi:hypothetical protein